MPLLHTVIVLITNRMTNGTRNTLSIHLWWYSIPKHSSGTIFGRSRRNELSTFTSASTIGPKVICSTKPNWVKTCAKLIKIRIGSKQVSFIAPNSTIYRHSHGVVIIFGASMSSYNVTVMRPPPMITTSTNSPVVDESSHGSHAPGVLAPKPELHVAHRSPFVPSVHGADWLKWCPGQCSSNGHRNTCLIAVVSVPCSDRLYPSRIAGFVADLPHSRHAVDSVSHGTHRMAKSEREAVMSSPCSLSV